MTKVKSWVRRANDKFAFATALTIETRISGTGLSCQKKSGAAARICFADCPLRYQPSSQYSAHLPSTVLPPTTPQIRKVGTTVDFDRTHDGLVTINVAPKPGISSVDSVIATQKVRRTGEMRRYDAIDAIFPKLTGDAYELLSYADDQIHPAKFMAIRRSSWPSLPTSRSRSPCMQAGRNPNAP